MKQFYVLTETNKVLRLDIGGIISVHAQIDGVWCMLCAINKRHADKVLPCFGVTEKEIAFIMGKISYGDYLLSF